MTTPAITPGIDTGAIQRLLPPWCVILHNDDVNSMDHVVYALISTVASLTIEDAAEIMLTAHNHGQATVVTCPKETAEHYRERLESFQLTVTIEPA